MTLTNVRRWTVDEYHRMIATGILGGDDRVELLEGQIVEMSPQLPPHASMTQRTARYCDRLFDGQAFVRMQLPVTLKPTSEPEPDIAIVRLSPNEYADHHPTLTEIFLLIEVADTSLAFDRGQKALTYARAEIADYWILDVNDRQVYALRTPTPNSYQQETVFGSSSVITPLAFPALTVSLQQLFP